jgi:putative peptidoglycan lipid II flippase
LTYITSMALIGAVIISLAAVPVSLDLRNLPAPNLFQAAIFGIILVTLTPLVGLTRLLNAICEAHGFYRMPAIAALINPLTFILILLVTTQWIGIYSLLCANLAGQTTELVILIVYARLKLYIPLRPKPQIHPAVREMLVQSLAPAVTYSALFFVPTLDRAAASILSPGSLTAFHYGERVVTLLDIIIMTGFIMVISNHWAQRVARHGINAAARTFNPVLSNLFFILVPLSLGGFALRYSIFSVLFHHGQFSADKESAQVFGLLLLSAPLNYMIVIIVRLLLLVRDVRAQMILAIGISTMNTILNVLLAPILGLAGIALSTFISRAIILALSYRFLRSSLSQINIKPILPNLVRTFYCTGIMLVFLLILQSFLSPALSRDNGLLTQIIALAITIGLTGSMYFAAANLTRHPELTLLRQTIMARLPMRFGSSQT